MLTPIKFKIPKINNIDRCKNFITFSPNSKDSNYTTYIKDKSLTNYFKNKNGNYNKIIKTKNINIYKSNNLSICDTFSNKIKNKGNKTKNLLLSSLFYLSYKHYKYNNNHSIKNKSKSNNIFENNKSHQNSFHKYNEIRNKSEENEDIKLENYMRDKFYEDIDKKMNIKLNSKNFLHDSSIKERIIKMNKIGLFWGSVFEYCNPLLSVKKLEFAKKHNNKKIFLKEDDRYIDEYNSKINKDIDIKPILYTNTLFSKLRRKERIKNEMLFYKYKNLTLNK